MLAAARLACADEFIEHLPDGYHTHMEQGERMYRVTNDKDSVLRGHF